MRCMAQMPRLYCSKMQGELMWHALLPVHSAQAVRSIEHRVLAHLAIFCTILKLDRRTLMTGCACRRMLAPH